MSVRAQTRDAGFTLVEVLISVFIFALLSVGTITALTGAIDTRERAEDRIEAINRLASVRRIMADDFGALTARRNRDGLGGVDPAILRYTADTIAFTRRGRPNPGGVFARGDLLRLAYRVEDGKLIRSFLPHENPALVEPAIDRVLLDGVSAMQVRRLRVVSGVLRPVFENQTELSAQALIEPSLFEIILDHDSGMQSRHVFRVAL